MHLVDVWYRRDEDGFWRVHDDRHGGDVFVSRPMPKRQARRYVLAAWRRERLLSASYERTRARLGGIL